MHSAGQVQGWQTVTKVDPYFHWHNRTTKSSLLVYDNLKLTLTGNRSTAAIFQLQ